MEKILEFNGSEYTNDSKHYRFQCDCLSAQDAMDIDVERCKDGKFIIIRLDFLHRSFWQRLKYARQIVMGHWTWREFVPREEDYSNLADIFSPDKGYDDLL